MGANVLCLPLTQDPTAEQGPEKYLISLGLSGEELARIMTCNSISKKRLTDHEFLDILEQSENMFFESTIDNYEAYLKETIQRRYPRISQNEPNMEILFDAMRILPHEVYLPFWDFISDASQSSTVCFIEKVLPKLIEKALLGLKNSSTEKPLGDGYLTKKRKREEVSVTEPNQPVTGCNVTTKIGDEKRKAKKMKGLSGTKPLRQSERISARNH